VIEKLGLAEQCKDQIRSGRRHHGSDSRSGGGTLGLTQISEIVEKSSAEFVSPLPDELQNYTGVAAGIPVNAHGRRR
jgi:hypothetical protein